VKSWVINTDPSRVLKQTVQGDIAIDSNSLKFNTAILQNEIGIRSLPGYTKFMSEGSGILNANGTNYPVYVIYTRIYSLNAQEIQFYTQPFGLTTDWIAFWDNSGNFYHIDSTSVDKPTPTYQTHNLAVLKDVNGAITKSFDLSINRGTKNPPEQYSVMINNPINATLNFNRINGVNKAANSTYTWYMGDIEGTVQKENGEKINGIGLVEYIHD
jgi:hypothetical protein